MNKKKERKLYTERELKNLTFGVRTLIATGSNKDRGTLTQSKCHFFIMSGIIIGTSRSK
jgi:hypothetical protein